jgi:predicted Zn-dependent protease
MQNDKEKAREVLQELLSAQPQNANAKSAMEQLDALH